MEKKAYLYGSEIQIIDFHLAAHGTPYCRVRILGTDWVNNVPVSCIEVR